MLRALVGALAESSSEPRAERFVVDMIACRLQGQELGALWEVRDPMGLLARVLANDGRGEPESRLLWASGKDTLMACFHVGVFSDKELVGQCKYRVHAFCPFLGNSLSFFPPPSPRRVGRDRGGNGG